MLEQYDRAASMLKWTIGHDSTNGFYSWPEGMNRADLSLAEGDMPHGWLCAAYITLLRNMLVRESGKDLMLISGLPSEWLRAGSRLSFADMPTEFGKLTCVVQSEKTGGDELRLKISMNLRSMHGKTPANYRIVLPNGWSGSLCTNASGPARNLPSRYIIMPSSVKTAVIQVIPRAE